MKRITGLMLCLVLLPTAYAEQPAANNQATPVETTLVTINGRPVTGLDMLIFNAQQGGEQINSQQAQVAVMNKLINTLVIAQAAEANKLDEDPQVVAAMDIARLQVLAEIQIQAFLKDNPVSDDQIKTAYETKYSTENLTEYEVAHILVDSEETAKQIITALDQGKKFADLAKEQSLDASKDNGGTLGWLEPGQVIKPFGEAMITLDKGGYTKSPVVTQFGWHVILLTDKRSKQPPALEDVKQELSASIQQQQLASYVSSLRDQAKIEIAGEEPPVKPAGTP